MSDLKTLKDIQCEYEGAIFDEINASEMRVAAREWIKILGEKKEDVDLLKSQVAYGTEKGTITFDGKELSGAIKIFKHFFNLESKEP